MRPDTIPPTPLLRLALRADALASGALALPLLLWGGPLSTLLGLPGGLLAAVAVVLLGWAALLAILAQRLTLPSWLVRAVILLNLVWVADSLLLLALGPALFGLAPTPLGTGFVLVQAAAVAGFALLQAAGLRGAARSLAA